MGTRPAVGSTQPWTGRARDEVRAQMARTLPTGCGVCGRVVAPGMPFAVGHSVPRVVAPELTWDPANWRVEHRECSDAGGTLAAKMKATYDTLRRAGTDHPTAVNLAVRGHGVALAPRPAAASPEQMGHENAPATVWADVSDTLPPSLAAVPPDGVPPRYMTARHPRAVGSYGEEFLEWAEDTQGIHPRRTEGLRWWQTMAAWRALEHDIDGLLVWRNVLMTVSRQVGKSWLLRAIMLWRIQKGLDWGEPQQVLHVAHKSLAAMEVWRPAARWAVAEPGFKTRWATGEQCIEFMDDGSRWMIQAANEGAGVAFSLSMILVDEAWRISRTIVDGALDPTLAESYNPQLWLVSTAGDSNSDLFGTYRSRALRTLTDPDNTLLIEWSAPDDADITSPETWRMASPLWTPRRESEVGEKLNKTEVIEFRQQWLNQWVQESGAQREDGTVQLISDPMLDKIEMNAAMVPIVAAIESWPGDGGVTLATAGALGDGSVLVSAQECASVSEAAAEAQGLGVQVLAGKSLLSDPLLAQAESRLGTSARALAWLQRAMDEGWLYMVPSPVLREQVTAARVSRVAEGVRVRTQGRLEAVKAVMWAAEYARSHTEAPGVF